MLIDTRKFKYGDFRAPVLGKNTINIGRKLEDRMQII